ncbi:MAG: polysulfide reductase NrfD [Cyclobacteriaceae bacterium]|nr:polysulfide reductase NrfD [Cyclobacteriaceae bacterium]
MNIEKTSKSLLKEFWPQMSKWTTRELIWLGFWGIIFLVGLYALYVQIVEGHVVTGMRDHVIWGVYIVNFIFFIGIGYTGAIVGGLLHLFDAEWRKPLMRIAALMTVISVIIGPLYILLCIGRLDRLYYLFIYPRLQSPIIWDVVAVMTFLVGGILFLYLLAIRDFAILSRSEETMPAWRRKIYLFMSAGFINTRMQRHDLKLALNVLSLLLIPTVIIVSSVLSWIFGMTLRPGWHSTIFGPYFVLAAVYTGTGVLVLLMYAFRKLHNLGAYIQERHFVYVGYMLIAMAAGYGYFTFSEYLTDWYTSEKWNAELIHKLMDLNQYGWMFYFANFAGILLPILLIGIPKFRSINTITFSAALLVIAMWFKRYLIIVPTLETPLLPMQDIRPEYVNYSATWVEWALTGAGIAMFMILFKVASKYIPIVPIWETSEMIEKEKQTKAATNGQPQPSLS